MTYKIIETSFSIDTYRRIASISMIKKPFFFWMQPKPMRHKVFFDMYDAKTTHKMYDGFATIDNDWISLGYKSRNEIRNVLTKYFAGEYTIGNFRDSLNKV